jgi:RES domain-containing protein
MQTRGRFAVGTSEAKIDRVDMECHRVTGPSIVATDLAAVSARSGRYHLAGWPQPLYASALRETALAEIERHASSPISGARVTIMAIEARLLDAYTPKGLTALGLRRRELVRRDHRRCIELSELARAVGSQGLLVPSAAAAGEANVVIWREDVASATRILRWEITTYPPPEEPTGTSY